MDASDLIIIEYRSIVFLEMIEELHSKTKKYKILINDNKF